MPKFDVCPTAIQTADRGVALCVPLTPQARQMLAGLQETGLFGRDVQEVAERLVCDRLIELTHEGVFADGDD